jgi:hypothetical protein
MKNIEDYKSDLTKASYMPELAQHIDSFASALSIFALILAVLDFIGVTVFYWETFGVLSLLIAFISALLVISSVYLPATILKAIANVLLYTHRSAEYTRIQTLAMLDYFNDKQNEKPAPTYNNNLPNL